jgi:hypothetical protein
VTARDRGVVRLLWALAVAVGVVGVGIFLSSGSQAGVLFVVIGVPLTIVVSVVVYVRRNAPSSRQIRTAENVLDSRADAVADRWREYVATRRRTAEGLNDWPPESVREEERTVREHLEGQSISVDPDTGRPAVQSGDRELPRLERLEARIEDLADEHDELVSARVRSRLEELDTLAAEIETRELTTLDGWTGPTALEDDAGAAAGLATLSEQRERLAEAVREGVETLRTAHGGLGNGTGSGTDAVVANAREAYERAGTPADVDAAAEALLAAHDAAEAEMTGALSEQAASLRTAADALLDVADELPPALVEKVERVERTIESIDSVSEVETLEEAESNLREAAVDATERLQSTIADREATLESVGVPEGFYHPPVEHDEVSARRIERTTTPGELSTAVRETVADLRPVLAALDERASVASAYADVEPLIDRQFDGRDRLTTDDVDLEPPGPFMRLYASSHDDARYDPDAEELIKE